MPREDLADFVHAAANLRGVTLPRGGKLDTCLSGRIGHAYRNALSLCLDQDHQTFGDDAVMCHCFGRLRSAHRGLERAHVGNLHH
jgi:hypothetical protein